MTRHNALPSARCGGFITGLLILAASTSALAAHPAELVRRGDGLYFDVAYGRNGGDTYGTSDVFVAKSSGTLDLTVNATDLGIDHDVLVPVTGSVHGDEIWWDFDVTLSGANINDFTWVSRVEGHIEVRADRIDGRADVRCLGGLSCPYSVRMVEDAEASWVRVHGTTVFVDWTEDIEVDFTAFAGDERPALDGLYFDAPRRVICANESTRSYTGRVELADAVPTTTYVHVMSTDPTVVPMTFVRVPAGETQGVFTVDVPGGYSGSIGIIVAAGGTAYSRDLEVAPPLYCLPGGFEYEARDFGLELSCSGCVEELTLASNGVALARVEGQDWRRSAYGEWTTLDDYLGFAIDGAVLSDAGDIAGLMAQDSSMAVMQRASEAWPETAFVEGLKVDALDARGIAYGSVGDAQWPTAAYWRGESIVQAKNSGTRITAATGMGPAVGGVMQDEWAAAELIGESMVPLNVAGSPSAAVASNAAGDIAGQTMVGETQHGFLLTAAGATEYISPPDEGMFVQPVGISDAGVVAFNYGYGDDIVGAGLYSKDTGSVALDELVEGDVGVEEIVSVNGSFDLVVRGVIDGNSTTFALLAGGE